LTERVDTVIVGGGQAGLALSYHLTEQGREHVLLEQAEAWAHVWRNHRWDSFTLVTPNWALRLPGLPYAGDNPDGFLTRGEVISYLENYAALFNPPVRFGVRVKSVQASREAGGYLVETTAEPYQASNVVVAAGLFQRPKIPAVGAGLPAGIAHLHSSQYRNPAALAPGAVLVVGSGQSGCQIAEELYKSGRTVHLCVGGAGRLPRRYRGRDAFSWLDRMGYFERTVDKLETPQAKFEGNPHISGKDGGHSLNLHQFARDGVRLLGRLAGATDGKIALAPDLHQNLAEADKLEAEFTKGVDEFIANNGLDAPRDQLPALRDGYEAEVVTALDLRAADIHTVIWAGGYTFDFSWVRLDTLDEDGYPTQARGVTAHPGLYFLGLHWLHTIKSGLFMGVGDDAAHVAAHIAARA
jgi:putative flavoprotein involved in K+ transport